MKSLRERLEEANQSVVKLVLVRRIDPQDRYGWANEVDTGKLKCSVCNNSWQKHWEKLYEQETGNKKNFNEQICASNKNPNTGLPCTRPAEDGAHVVHLGVNKVWIAPLCSECNHPTNEEVFPLKVGTIIVDAEPCK